LYHSKVADTRTYADELTYAWHGEN